jgi:hypothetical protein
MEYRKSIHGPVITWISADKNYSYQTIFFKSPMPNFNKIYETVNWMFGKVKLWSYIK